MPTQRLPRCPRTPTAPRSLVDFDGSLSPIVQRAEDARLLPNTLPVLARLAAGLGRLAIVSGRPVGFLAGELPVDGIALVGLYGMERLINGEYSVDPRVEPYLVAVAAATAELEAKLPREVVERKSGICVTMHWRPVPEQAEHIVEIARAVGARHGLGELRTRMAIELRPPIDVDKSVATRSLIEGFDVAAFAGDDYGDLPAFAELARALDDGRLQRAGPDRRAVERGAARTGGCGRRDRRRAARAGRTTRPPGGADR